MNFDWIIRNARTVGMAPDQPSVDIGIRGETIAAVEVGLKVNDPLDQERIIAAEGRLVSPGLIETHVHLDKSRIMDRCTPSPNRGSDHPIDADLLVLAPLLRIAGDEVSLVAVDNPGAAEEALAQGAPAIHPGGNLLGGDRTNR
ncbi:MAG: hypothetical protein O6934_13695 [SAR324 cluster bacterium]|nr:hypothetical protein [SAR324 cluster bacterium]